MQRAGVQPNRCTDGSPPERTGIYSVTIGIQSESNQGTNRNIASDSTESILLAGRSKNRNRWCEHESQPCSLSATSQERTP